MTNGIFKGQWTTLKGNTIEDIFKANTNTNFFLDEMPFDDFKPGCSSTSSIVSLANILKPDKLLWVACRNQSTPMPKKLQGIKLKKSLILFFGTKLLCTSILAACGSVA
jgi:hypothetical protein